MDVGVLGTELRVGASSGLSNVETCRFGLLVEASKHTGQQRRTQQLRIDLH